MSETNTVITNKAPSDFKLEQHSFRLLKNEPFFTAISRAVTKIQSKIIPTAGVCVNPDTGYFEMHYNSEFFSQLGKTDENGVIITDEKKIIERREIESLGVLKHEFYHLIFEHVTDRLPFDMKDHSKEAMKTAKMWNIACDLAINSEIYKELPWSACVPGRVYTDPVTGKKTKGFTGYPMGLTAEAYFELLKEESSSQEEGEGEGEGEGDVGNGVLDDHSMWGGEGTANECDPIMREIAKERLKDIIKEAANEAVSCGKGWGNVSNKMQKEIIRRLTSIVDWKSILRYFVKTSQKANRISSMRKLNRRYPYIQAGKKISRTAKIAISIDQSGSVSDAMLGAFFNELNSLSNIAAFTVIPFDDAVFEEKVYVWKKGERKNRERVLCGGTNFDAPTNYVNEKAFDGHIILTDLMAPKPGNSKCQRMWMTTESCANSPYFRTQEKIISIPEKDIKNYEI